MITTGQARTGQEVSSTTTTGTRQLSRPSAAVFRNDRPTERGRIVDPYGGAGKTLFFPRSIILTAPTEEMTFDTFNATTTMQFNLQDADASMFSSRTPPKSLIYGFVVSSVVQWQRGSDGSGAEALPSLGVSSCR